MQEYSRPAPGKQRRNGWGCSALIMGLLVCFVLVGITGSWVITHPEPARIPIVCDALTKRAAPLQFAGLRVKGWGVMAVVGNSAGSPAANGTYAVVGTHNGVDLYQNENGMYLFWDGGGMWVVDMVVDDLGMPYYGYLIFPGGDSPPLGSYDKAPAGSFPNLVISGGSPPASTFVPKITIE